MLIGACTGAVAFPVVLGWMMRRFHHPEVQGRRALLYLWACTLLVLVMISFLFVPVLTRWMGMG